MRSLPAGGPEEKSSHRRDALVVFAVALVARLAVVAWAAGRFPPSADGQYYAKVAERIAAGHGYTWLWPDGAVTYAAHYPVGYPALVALGYVVFGSKPVVAMLVNALVGAAGAAAVRSLLAAADPRRRALALAGGLVAALHPALVPYTAALMTEGVTASLLALAAATAESARCVPAGPTGAARLVATGLLMGVATLVRPQCLALAPVLGWLAASGSEGTTRRRAGAAALVTALALATCAPWTARNCVRMEKCALVSVNGGWNLAIGTQTDTGGWHELAVPDACKEVFQEAAKDDCFGREARRTIAQDPLAWLARAPAKLRVTLDYFGAAPWYLHTANPDSFPWSAKVALGAVETVVSRLLLAVALACVGLAGTRLAGTWAAVRAAIGPRQVVAAVGLVGCFREHGAYAYLALAVAIALLGRRILARAPLVVPFTAALIAVTAATHAVFFGAGRYGLILVPFVSAIGFALSEMAETETKRPVPADLGEGPDISL